MPTKFNIGSSLPKQAGFINIDIDSESKSEIVCEISKGILLPSRSVTMIANHVLEHEDAGGIAAHDFLQESEQG